MQILGHTRGKRTRQYTETAASLNASQRLPEAIEQAGKAAAEQLEEDW